jgi:hypothetical protein
MNDLISRKWLMECVDEGWIKFDAEKDKNRYIHLVRDIAPSAQFFHNITMNDVLKYIDGMPEDAWQEFTACLECRGWELQRRTAKWCGGEFA